RHGVAAASAFHLAQISLDVGTHTVVSPLVIDFPVTLHGGYARSASQWAPTLFSSTTIVLQQGPVDDAQLTVTGGDLVTISDLAVRRSGACRDDCAVINVDNSPVALSSVIVGDPAVLSAVPGANDAAGHVYVSVYVGADAPVDGANYTFTAEHLTTYGSLN